MFILSPAWPGRLLEAQSIAGCLLGSFPSYQQGRAVRSSLHAVFLWSRAWPRSQPQLLPLCWCCLGLPGAFPQALGMIHSDKQNSGWNSRDKCISSQNLGPILPLHIWSFNLQTSVPFLAVFHLKSIKTINTQCFQGENTTWGRVLVFWSKRVQCWDAKALGS